MLRLRLNKLILMTLYVRRHVFDVHDGFDCNHHSPSNKFHFLWISQVREIFTCDVTMTILCALWNSHGKSFSNSNSHLFFSYAHTTFRSLSTNFVMRIIQFCVTRYPALIFFSSAVISSVRQFRTKCSRNFVQYFPLWLISSLCFFTPLSLTFSFTRWLLITECTLVLFYTLSWLMCRTTFADVDAAMHIAYQINNEKTYLFELAKETSCLCVCTRARLAKLSYV